MPIPGWLGIPKHEPSQPGLPFFSCVPSVQTRVMSPVLVNVCVILVNLKTFFSPNTVVVLCSYPVEIHLYWKNTFGVNFLSLSPFALLLALQKERVTWICWCYDQKLMPFVSNHDFRTQLIKFGKNPEKFPWSHSKPGQPGLPWLCLYPPPLPPAPCPPAPLQHANLFWCKKCLWPSLSQ